MAKSDSDSDSDSKSHRTDPAWSLPTPPRSPRLRLRMVPQPTGMARQNTSYSFTHLILPQDKRKFAQAKVWRRTRLRSLGSGSLKPEAIFHEHLLSAWPSIGPHAEGDPGNPRSGTYLGPAEAAAYPTIGRDGVCDPTPPLLSSVSLPGLVVLIAAGSICVSRLQELRKPVAGTLLLQYPSGLCPLHQGTGSS